METLTFSERVILQAIGPVVSAVIGTLIFGIFVAWITRRAQERRADDQLREERTRAQNQMRVELVSQMTEAASTLYIATQDYWRKKRNKGANDDELKKARTDLDQQYRASRVAGEVIERRLEAYFSSSDKPRAQNKPLVLWHATMDLLTVRYFQLIDLATDELLKRNAGEEHTGLTVEELKDPAIVLTTYHERLRLGAQAALHEPIVLE